MPTARPLLPLLLACLALLPACDSPTFTGAAGLTLDAEAEGGRRWLAGPVPVLELQGSYRAMGRQYGLLAGAEMQHTYQVFTSYWVSHEPPIPAASLEEIGETVYQTYPQRYRQMIDGMAETSGLTLAEQKTLNALEQVILFYFFTGPRCSGLGAFGPYTGGGPVVFGRNNDDQAYMNALDSVVVVLKPDDGSIPVATMIYAGVIYSATGINRDGLFLELNSGSQFAFDAARSLTLVTLLSFLQDYSDVDAVEPAFRSLRVNMSVLVNAADPAGVSSFECPLTDAECVRRGPDQDGLLVGTNHFLDPSWGTQFPEATATPEEDAATNGSTRARHDNLVTLAEARKGQIDAEVMKAIFDTPLTFLADGTADPTSGATVIGDASATIQSVVVVPETRTMHLKVRGAFDWQRIELADLLQ
jgi:hypothetical protein